MRKILLHVEPNDARERERWATRLREAAQLRIEHLYEYDASQGGKYLEKGTTQLFAMVGGAETIQINPG